MDNPLYSKIENSTAHRQARDLISNEVISNPKSFPQLLQMALDPTTKSHYKACLILELILEQHPNWLAPYLDRFTAVLPFYKHDGAIRSVSKIGMFLARQHMKNKLLSEAQIHKITENCFDWLISEQKVAAKVYAMRTLFELGKLQQWIYPELKTIIQKDYMHHTAAYKAASRDILKRMS